MKKFNIKALSILLALVMLLGILASCATVEETTVAGSSETEDSTVTTQRETNDGDNSTEENPDKSDTEEDNSTEGTSYESAEQDSDSEEVTESEALTDSEETTTVDESEAPTVTEDTYVSLIDGENAELIENADRLVNGVNAYYTDTDRTAFHFYNKNTAVTCDLQSTKLVSSISDRYGNSYIENTMDVFIKMTDGSTYYASNSSDNAIANIFKNSNCKFISSSITKVS